MTTLTRIGGAAIVIAASATTASAARLMYEMHPNDLACPTQARFADEVSAKLGFSPWIDDGQTVRVTISLSAGRYTGHFAPEHDHDREFRADTCRRVADLLVTAAAIALDHPDPVAARSPSSTTTTTTTTTAMHTRVATADGPAPREGELVLPANPATEWAFAPRNNHLQIGAGMDSIAGTFMASAAVPLFAGHLELGLGHRTNNLIENASSSLTFVDALYVWPIFYINKNSSFEVPFYAGGGVSMMWSSVNAGGTAMMTTSQSKLIPELAITQGLQFRKLPAEFMFGMTLALSDPPSGGSNFGVDVAIRYVFRGL